MSRPAFTLLVCPDAALALREMERQAAGLDRRVVYGDEPLPASFWQDLASPGLFGGSKALAVRRAEQLPAQVWKELAPYLRGAALAAWPFFFLESPWERGQPKLPAHLAGQPCVALAKERGWLWQQPGLSAKTLPAHVRAVLADHGLSAAGPVLETLCQRLPEDAAGVAAEVAKLALAGPVPRALEPADLELLTGSRSLDLWQVLEAVEQGRDRALVWKEVLADRAGLLFPLLAGLGREARSVGALLEGQAGGMPPWLAQKKERLARRLGRDGLAELLSLALEAELAVKSGEKAEDQALEELVAGLFQLFAAPARG